MLFRSHEQEIKIPRELWHRDSCDEAILRESVQQHAAYTGSARAAEMLANWSQWRAKFVKVFPSEYKRALGELTAKNRKLAA